MHKKKALHLVQGSSITTCTDITFHSVNSGWAGFEIKKQWSRNLADFIIIINKLSNFSSVQQQQKKKSGQKKTPNQTNQELNGFKQTNKRVLQKDRSNTPHVTLCWVQQVVWDVLYSGTAVRHTSI